jgi:hypothetical protein
MAADARDFCAARAPGRMAMKVKVYVVDLPVPSFFKKWGLRLGIPTLAILAGGVAFAGLPGGYADGQPLTKAALDANFNYLQGEIPVVYGANGAGCSPTCAVTNPKVFTGTFVTSLVGGAPTENVNVDISSAGFTNVPFGVAQLTSAPRNDELGVYSHSASTATKAIVYVSSATSANLPAGAHRIDLVLIGN